MTPRPNGCMREAVFFGKNITSTFCSKDTVVILPWHLALSISKMAFLPALNPIYESNHSKYLKIIVEFIHPFALLVYFSHIFLGMDNEYCNLLLFT